MGEQLALPSLLSEAERLAEDHRILHRGRVQAWYDGLPEEHKEKLAEWMIGNEWDTCSALSVAACDHYLSRRKADRGRQDEKAELVDRLLTELMADL